MTNRFSFLKSKIEALPAPEMGRATFYDADVQKLALRVTAAGSKTFYVVKHADEGMARIKLGVFPDMTVEQARNQATKKLGEFAAGNSPAKVKRAEEQKQTLGQAFDQSVTGHISPPKKRWRKLLERAAPEDFTIHDLRRSLGSWQAIGGASLAVIGKSLSHKSADASMIYARLSIDPVRQSVTSAMLVAAGLKKPAKVVKLAKTS